MLPGMELMSCPNLAVPNDVMQHVVHVESAFNPYAIGVVGGRLARQPRNLSEAVATVRMLEARGFNFSVGLAQVNRYNFDRYGLDSYERAFQACPNLQAGSRILAECYGRSGGDWGKSFSCYYSGNFTTGFRHGYVQKVYASMRGSADGAAAPIEVIAGGAAKSALPQRRSREGVDGATWRRRLETAAMRAVEPAPGLKMPEASAPASSQPVQTTAVVLQPANPASAAQVPLPAVPQSSASPGDQAFVF
jgi:type IV secretion system protein VirB1